MTSLALMLSPLFALQSVGQTTIAIENDNPETWTLEYPRIVQPYVQDYRRCLVGGDRRVTGQPDFEVQHRSDVPRCLEVREEAEANANEVLANRTGFDSFPPDEVNRIFDLIGRIHIARGADLDQQFTQRLQASEQARAQYDDERPRGLVVELLDGSVVRSRMEASAEAAEAAGEEP